MQLNQQGFTLLETLIAMALSSVVLLGAARLLPALQGGIIREYQHIALQESAWQLIFGIGKYLQRAGYCHGSCAGEGLRLLNEGQCVLVQWDTNSNGSWDSSSNGQSEQTGYRLRNNNLEIQRGATNCDGGGWEKISDPDLLIIKRFSVTRQNRNQGQPLLLVNIAAMPAGGGREIALRHVVVGNNL